MSLYPEGTRWNEWGEAVPPMSCPVCQAVIPVRFESNTWWVCRCPNGCATLTCRDGEWHTEEHEPAS